jgi:type II secretory ATPase GspE/PulE/Tfp pilus assembly ATPase PilB-like protein
LAAALAWIGPGVAMVAAQDAAAPDGAAADTVTDETTNAGAAPATSTDAPFHWSLVFQFLGLALLVLAWIATSDWVNRDAQIFSLGYQKWGPIVFFPFAVLLFGLMFAPISNLIRLPILAVVYLATLVPYIVVHNRSVLPHQTVLTGSWWRHIFASLMAKLGVKMSGERQAEYEKGAAVELFAIGAPDANQDNANLLTARQSPGYLLVKDLVAEMVGRRGERALLEYGPQAVAVRYEVDGVWHNGEARDREGADVMLAVIKTLANLNVKDRRSKQEGKFAAKFEGAKYMLPVVSQGVANGERVIVTRLQDKSKPQTYEAIGIREALRDKWAELMAADRGLLIFSAMPSGGLTTMMDASLDETDRLMRDFVAIEDVHRRERELQNIAVHTYDPAAGETPATLMPRLVRQYPNVYVVRNFVDAESAKVLMDEVADERLIITSIPARDAAEALLRLLQMKLPQKQFAEVVTGVLYQRLIRKLCPDCKVGYQPPPDVLKKLGIPSGKVQQLFRPPKPEEIEKPCQTCQGIGYVGRTGIFELLVVNDQMREILAKQPSVDLLRKAARADGQRSLQEEGILLVAKGVTSLPELQRVLKT